MSIKLSPIHNKRLSGVLLHPSSLPGEFGIGDIGPEAQKFVKTLAEASQRVWQVLPLGPTFEYEYHSPYSSFSAFGASPLLISPELLFQKGYISKAALTKAKASFTKSKLNQVDFKKVAKIKDQLLREAFLSQKAQKQKAALQAFAKSNPWVVDVAQFAVLFEHFKKPRNTWPKEFRIKSKDVVKLVNLTGREELNFHIFSQFVFFDQWKELKQFANSLGVAIVGDIPIYVADNSADVWGSPQYFELDKSYCAKLVSGVPPDAFSATGQLWNHPVFNWKTIQNDDFSWWVERMRVLTSLCDVVRIDHFRGLESFWAVRGGSKTAENGSWLPCPGAELLKAIVDKLGSLPVIAEDLGIITPAVNQLRDMFNLPGMKVLQFGFGNERSIRKNPHAPFNFSKNQAVYTGTHDNMTSLEWFQKLKRAPKERLLKFLGNPSAKEFTFEFIRMAESSAADLCIIPLQDVMNLGREARMNMPGIQSWKNWSYRFESISKEKLNRVGELSKLYERQDSVFQVKK